MTAVESRPPVADDTAERVHAPEAGGLGGRHFWGEVRLSLLTLFVTYAALAGALRLWRANLRVPFIYGGDANSHAMLFKAVMEHGWYEANPNLGAPYGQHFHDFPMADNLHLVVGKVLGLFTHSYALVVNVYFLATFGLAALTALWVLRWLGMSRPVSLVMSVLFAILPYHFMRGETHLFLAAYYGVPLATYLLFKAVRGESLLGDVAARHGWRSRRVVLRLVGLLGICVVVGSASSYYASFALLLVLAMTLLAVIRRRSWRAALPGLAIVALVAGVQFVNLLPDLAYQRVHGANEAVAHRSPVETEVFSLKLSQLVLPMDYHRVRAAAKLRTRYITTFPIPSEGAQISLGLMAALGFLWLLLVPLLSMTGAEGRRIDVRHRELSAFAVVAFLVATTGGLSTLVALLVTTQLRAWNRMTIYLAFFSLCALGLLLDGLGARLRAWKTRPRVGGPALAAVLVLVLMVGWYDQTSNAFIPTYKATADDFGSDDVFVRQIEAALPRGAMVFQLPYVPFPEFPPVVHMMDYDELRGYLHSKHLRWSYGGIKGRPDADWQTPLSRQPVATVLAAASIVGYQGLYLDRYGYLDDGRSIEAEITAAVGSPPQIVSPNNRLAFWPMRSFAERVRASMSADALRNVKDVVLRPTTFAYGAGFFQDETGGGHVWRWARQQSTVMLDNPSKETREVTLHMALATGSGDAFPARLELPDGTVQTVDVSQTPTPLDLRLRLAPGPHAIKLSTEAPGVMGDARDIHLQVIDAVVLNNELVSFRP